MAFVISSKRFNRLNNFENILLEAGLTDDEAIEILRSHVDGTPPMPLDLWGADIHTAAGLLEEY